MNSTHVPYLNSFKVGQIGRDTHLRSGNSFVSFHGEQSPIGTRKQHLILRHENMVSYQVKSQVNTN